MTGDELIRAYFRRLELRVPEKLIPDGDTLIKLHRRHTLMIPYENTDYLTGDIKPTDFETQFHEVITGMRGGMCIDMNPLFGRLLSALGYRVRCFSTVICTRPEDDLNFHAILQVEDCDGRAWWCDIANPFTRFYEPLPLTPEKELSASGSLFRFEERESGKLLLQEKKAGTWKDFLQIKDRDITEEDRNESKFGAVKEYPSNPIFFVETFSLVTPEGRRTLIGNVYRESAKGNKYQYSCSDELMSWAYAQFGLKKTIGRMKNG